MAKIENTSAYPTVTPAAEDLLIATDVSDDNRTVTFLVSDLMTQTTLQGLQSVLDTGNIAIEDINLTGDINVVGTVYPSTITASGSVGTAGQILSSTGSGLQWIAAPVTNETLQQVLDNGNTATQNINLTGNIVVDGAGNGVSLVGASTDLSVDGASHLGGVVTMGTSISFVHASVDIALLDENGLAGTAGQVLVSTGTSVEWSSTLPVTPNLQQVLQSGNTASNVGMTFSGAGVITLGSGNPILSAGSNTFTGTNTFTGVLDIDSTLEDSAGSVGTSGQVLTSTGTGVIWSANAGIQGLQGVLDTSNTATEDINLTGDITVTGDIETTTITASGSTGTAGQILSSTGSGIQWIADAAKPLQDVLDAGNSANQNITLTTAGNTITAPLLDPDQIIDTAGGTGAAGQVLSSTGGGLAWVDQSGASATRIITGTHRFIAENVDLIENAYTYQDQTVPGSKGTILLNQVFLPAAVTPKMSLFGAIYRSPATAFTDTDKRVSSASVTLSGDAQTVDIAIYKVRGCDTYPLSANKVAFATAVIASEDQTVCYDLTIDTAYDDLARNEILILVIEGGSINNASLFGVLTYEMELT